MVKYWCQGDESDEMPNFIIIDVSIEKSHADEHKKRVQTVLQYAPKW